jgi:polysaccharide export outer membrane protein
LLAALTLSGRLGRPAPIAMAPQASLDTVAYGQTYAPAPVSVAHAEPAPGRYDAPYHLDAGDRLRVVVYGQEGLTNTYAIDAGGSITMPLIGQVAARGRTPAGLASKSPAACARVLFASLQWRWKSNPTVPSSSSARWRPRANTPMYRT